MTATGIGAFLIAAFWPPVWAAAWLAVTRRFPFLRWHGIGREIAEIAAATVIVFAVLREWPADAGAAAALIAGIVIWWWRRRKRRSAAALIGDKSRLILAAIMRKMRETAAPRPVLRPRPGGAS